MMSMCSHLLCCWMRVFAMTSVYSWQNCVRLVLLHFVLHAQLACYSRYLLTSYFCIPVPYALKDILYFMVLVLEGIVCLHRTFWLSCWGTALDYCDVEWSTLEMNQDHSFVLEIIPKCWISDSFVDYEGYYISSKGFLPTIVDIMVIWIKFTHSHPF